MTGRILTVSTLVALAQAKAIITNHCPYEVFIWSVPNVGPANIHIDDLLLRAGERYEEAWRYGTAENPGIALKISPQQHGIYQGKDEINFAYTIEHSDKSKVWVDLTSVRGKAFDNNLSFHTCHGSFKSTDVHTSQCQATDNIELVLCGTARAMAAKDNLSLQKITDCYDYGHNSDKYGASLIKHPHAETPAPSTASTTPQSWTWPPKPTPVEPIQRPSKFASSKSCQESSKTTSTTQTTPYNEPPKYSSSVLPTYTSIKAPIYSSSEPPKYTSSSSAKEAYYQPPTYTSSEPYAPPAKVSTTTTTRTVVTRVTVTKPDHEHTVAYFPPPSSTTATYYGPPQYTSEKHYDPPKYTSDTSRPPYTSTPRTYSPSTTDRAHPSAPKYTSSEPEYELFRPAYHTHGDRTAIFPSGYVPQSTPYGDKHISRREESFEWEWPYSYCRPKITAPEQEAKLARKDDSSAAAGQMTTIPLREVLQHEAAKHQTTPTLTGESGNTVLTRSLASKPKRCALPYCEPVQPGLHCEEVQKAFIEADEHQIDWTTSNDACYLFLMGRNVANGSALLPPHAPLYATLDERGRQKMCMGNRCDGLSKKACKKYKKLMEQLAKDKDIKADYTTDEEVCGKAKTWRGPRSQRRAIVEKRKTKICVLPWCENLGKKECKKMENKLEDIAKENGVHWDYTTDDDVCDGSKALGRSNATMAV